MAQTDLTAEDFFGSINGFDEIAIARAFGEDISALRKRPFTFMRALVFVDARRKGQKDDAAINDALSLSMKDLEAYFPDEIPEIDPDEPETDPGKDVTLFD